MNYRPDDSLPKYVNESVTAFEKMLAGDNFSAFEKITKLSRGEIFALKVLLFHDGVSNPTQLSKAMNSTKGRISAILNALAKKGYIEREIDPDNRRNIIVTLTDSGRKYITDELRDYYKVVTHVFEELGKKDSRRFIELSERVVRLMNE